MANHFGVDEHPFATYFDVHQGYRVLTHSHIHEIRGRCSPSEYRMKSESMLIGCCRPPRKKRNNNCLWVQCRKSVYCFNQKDMQSKDPFPEKPLRLWHLMSAGMGLSDLKLATRLPRQKKDGILKFSEIEHDLSFWGGR